MIDTIELILVFVMTLFTLIRKKTHLFKLYNDRFWFLNMILVSCFTLFVFNKQSIYGLIYPSYVQNNETKKNAKQSIAAIKKALFALLIAILAYLDLTIAPFWLVYFVYVNLGDEWL